MKIDFSQNREHLAELEKKLCISFEGGHWLSVVGEGGTLLAVVAYYGFSAGNCEFSVATFGQHPFSRQILRTLFAYPFQQLQLRRVTAVSSFNNPRAVNLLERLGFVKEGVVRNWFPDAHGLLLGMTREECKWLS